MQDHDWQKIAPDVAKQLLGEPKVQKSDEWRYGNKGSLVFNVSAGTFYDFESGEGGGVAWLIKHLGKDINDIVKQYGYDLPLPKNNSLLGNSPSPKSSGRSFTKQQMWELHSQAVVKVQYASNFWVMRFPEGHAISMKYAPFTLNPDGTWSMKRPEGLLPIYCTDKHLEKPVIVNEGEKAMRGAEQIYQGDVACWHGGVNSIEKQDWSKLYGREVWIWADNDEAGKKVAVEIAEHLRANNGTKVKVITPPEDFAEKDD